MIYCAFINFDIPEPLQIQYSSSMCLFKMLIYGYLTNQSYIIV